MDTQASALVDALETRQLRACEGALALGRTDRDQAVQILRALVHEGDSAVRKRAAECMMELGGDLAIVVLGDLLRDQNHNVRVTAALALGRIHARSAMSELARLLENDPHVEVRLAAARALGMLQDHRGLDMVMKMLYGSDERRCRLAVTALKDIIGQRFSPDKAGIDAAKRYLQVQIKRFVNGD